MATLIQFQQKLARLNNIKALELIVFTEIKRYENLFVNAQKKQLNKGEDYEGSPIANKKGNSTYSFESERIAKLTNPRKPKEEGQPFNFENTGGLFDGMELLVDGTQAQFWSTDSKTPELVVEYKNLFGLQESALKEIIQRVILPAFLIQIRKELGLG